MLARWLDRGLGQIVAPDERVAAEPKQEEANASFWRMVAPDPVWEASQHGPATSATKTPARTHHRQGSVPPPPAAFSLASPPEMPTEVVCRHCHRVTPVIIHPSTPRADHEGATPEFMSPLEKQVLVAAKGTAESILSPSYVTDARNKVFRLCASCKPLQDKLLQKLQKILQQDPSLLSARASSMGNLVPDGLTPLMAAAFVNQVDVAKLIVELDPNTKTHVDLQGRTALHIAAEMGSLDVARLLQSNDTLGIRAPLDLLGNTPLGRAVTSHQKSARRAQTQLTQVLFSPGDPSVSGAPTPSHHRMVTHSSVPVGYAQMPGFRVKMEDALSIHSWEGHALLGVCDGHGDNAQVSTLVATEVKDIYKIQPMELPEDQRWIHTCLALDESVRNAGYQGGSTGIWACITESTIVVVNVGDCRCILVQENNDKLVAKMGLMQIDEAVEETKDEPSLIPEGKHETVAAETEANRSLSQSSKVGDGAFTEGGEQTSENKSAVAVQESPSYSVFPLSTDHKPDLASEQARIEGAGMSVIQDTFYDEHGLKQSIAKIQLGPGHMMAVARAFGDFDYKSNPTLGPEQQAVTVIPDVKTFVRSPNDLYLVLACDGIWDVMSNEQVADFVVHHVDKLVAADEGDVLPKVGDLLLAECLNLGSKDNMSVIIVSLSGTAKTVGSSGVMEGKALRF